MDAGDLEYLHVTQAGVAQQIREGSGGAADLLGREALRRDTGDSSQFEKQSLELLEPIVDTAKD